MKVTSVKVIKIDRGGSRMKGKASVLLDDCFAVHDIRIIDGNEGLFIAMPSKQITRRPADGEEFVENWDIVHPINKETRQMFQDAILEAYNNVEPKE